MYLLKSWEKSIKHAVTILPVGNQKMLTEKLCDERHNYFTLDHKNWVDYLPFLGEIKMEGILMTVFGTGIITMAFVRTNGAFGKDGCGDYEAEGKPRDLAEE